MARYLIGTALTNKGTVRKQQPADKFRKLLIRQKTPFTERGLYPMMDSIDSELKNFCWDRRRFRFNVQIKSYRMSTDVTQWPATEFTFDERAV